MANGQMTAQQLADRLLQQAVRVIQTVKTLPKTNVGRHVGRQLLRAGTSPGANYEEACGAESRADFTHKLGIVLKELKESRYWLRLAPYVSGRNEPEPGFSNLLSEVEELIRIFARSVSTLRRAASSK